MEMRNPPDASFYKEMDASFMHHMSLPPKFTTNFGDRIRETVKLKGPSGNIWQVGVTKRAEEFIFQSEWKEFILANDIKERDILTFKYNGNSSFEVRIFQHKGCERISSIFAKKEQNDLHNLNSCSIHQVNGPGSSSDSEIHVEQSPTRDERPKRRPKKGDAPISQIQRDICKMHDGRPFMYLAHKLRLTDAQNRKALHLAREVQRRNPYFVDVINFFCLKAFVLSIPSKFSVAYLPTETLKATLHYEGRIWNAMYIYNKRKKQIGSTGWKSFVVNNNLRVGDVCLFELLEVHNDIISFQVHLQKK